MKRLAGDGVVLADELQRHGVEGERLLRAALLLVHGADAVAGDADVRVVVPEHLWNLKWEKCLEKTPRKRTPLSLQMLSKICEMCCSC